MILQRLFFSVLIQMVLSYDFTDDNWNQFDAYGVKLATNDNVVVQARNIDAYFVIQFAPFNASNLSSPCHVNYAGSKSNDTNFIYNIVVPEGDVNGASVIFVGENTDNSTSPYPFVGHLRVNSSCMATYDIQYFNSSGHDEFFVVGVDPSGQQAYGFSSQFAFSYNLQTHTITLLQQWPIPNFTPHAVDVSSNYVAIIAGFVTTTQNVYNPYIYMLQMNISSYSIVETWPYVPSSSSWQATTTNRDASTFTRKHMMSVSIHDNTSAVLVGMPSFNIVFWFNIEGTNLTVFGQRENGYQRGYGQSLGWSDESGGPYPVILANTYTFPYEWSSSIIYWFYPAQFLSSNPIMPMLPTVQCPLWVDLQQELLTIAMGTLNLVLLDSSGQVYVMLAAAEGFYPDTSVAIGTNPTFSNPTSCPAGTFKNWVGVYICYPCTAGQMNTDDGNAEWLTYGCDGENSICPLGSITNDTYSDMTTSISQEVSYPESPESIIFDDILIVNMFSFGTSTSCLMVSPVFWTMVMTGFVMLILLIMGILKFSKQHVKTRLMIKRIFRQADIIREGELWVGGLASLALIVLVMFAYHFSGSYLNQYPIETAPPSTFACDQTIRNAKFQTNLQSLTTPRSEEVEPIFELLDEQHFKLTIDFINTQQNCDDVTITQIVHSYSQVILSNCTYNRSTVTVSTTLQSHTVSLIYNFAKAVSIGGFRISFYSEQIELNNKSSNSNYFVQEFNFVQPFFVYNQTMAYDPTIVYELTRIINQTYPLDDNGLYSYNALWSPVTTSSTSDLFLTYEEYMYYGLLKTTFTISISEVTYYTMNVQQPIAKKSEIIFHNLLFTTVCLELFGLMFIGMKLIGLPLFNGFRYFIEKHSNLIHPEPFSDKSNEALKTQEPFPSYFKPVPNKLNETSKTQEQLPKYSKPVADKLNETSKTQDQLPKYSKPVPNKSNEASKTQEQLPKYSKPISDKSNEVSKTREQLPKYFKPVAGKNQNRSKIALHPGSVNLDCIYVPDTVYWSSFTVTDIIRSGLGSMSFSYNGVCAAGD
ncbi:unnamed protein product [Adineta steineri]|uniref:Uncharacterized protein n=1 Tax=Adineta steineri TaxID=433720 RepID=A0A818TCL2_9BILA|nr:unnamed protein product [Adineta steineri]